MAGDGFYAANTSGNGAFCNKFKDPDLVGVGNVNATTQFDGLTKFNNANGVAVFFSKECHGTFFLGTFDIECAVFL